MAHRTHTHDCRIAARTRASVTIQEEEDGLLVGPATLELEAVTGGPKVSMLLIEDDLRELASMCTRAADRYAELLERDPLGGAGCMKNPRAPYAAHRWGTVGSNAVCIVCDLCQHAALERAGRAEPRTVGPIEKLEAPPTVHGREIASVVQTSDGGIAVVLHPHVWDYPQNWGIPIADFVRNVALMYAKGDPECERRVLKEIRVVLDAELAAPTSEVLPPQKAD